MPEYLILTEKSSAFEHFKKALGGVEGTYNGKSYRLTHSRGHLYGLASPELQVPEEYKDEYASWNPKDMPWNSKLLKWKNKPLKDTKSVIDSIRDAGRDCDKLVIATDTDESGEGDLLGWEIVNGINWQKPVLRMRFNSETVSGLQKAFNDIYDISDKEQQPEYLRSLARSRFDFITIQLTRIATSAARQAGYNVRVSNQGRLKSVIMTSIFNQLQEIKNYKKTPFYEARYKDDNGHVYKRSVNDDNRSDIHLSDKSDAEQEAKYLGQGSITNVKETEKTQAPGQMLTLLDISTKLASKGYSDSEILETYQKLYDNSYLSYPRTGDIKIMQDDYDDLLPSADKIAKVVGVDPALLSHKTLRKVHKATEGDHGPNRPGEKVPKSLDDLDRYGRAAKDIYKLVAKSYLAILGEDHKYKAVTAEIKEHPEFKTSFRIDIAGNDFKKIADDIEAFYKKDDENDDVDNTQKPVGTIADTFVYEGANPKPSKPTKKWIASFLKRHNIGTPATQVSTLANMAKGKQPLLTLKKGVYDLTDSGLVSAVLALNTWIGGVAVTKKLLNYMVEVGPKDKKGISVQQIVKVADQLIAHDKPLLMSNAKYLSKYLGDPKGSLKGFEKKEKATVTFKGKEISFNKSFAGHQFTEDEISKLAEGEEIIIPIKTKYGESKAKGSLAQMEYKGKKFWGFSGDLLDNKIHGRLKDDTEVKFSPSWGGHTFTKDEISELLAGNEIKFKFKSKKGKTMTISGSLKENTGKYKGWGFQPNFDK